MLSECFSSYALHLVNEHRFYQNKFHVLNIYSVANIGVFNKTINVSIVQYGWGVQKPAANHSRPCNQYWVSSFLKQTSMNFSSARTKLQFKCKYEPCSCQKKELVQFIFSSFFATWSDFVRLSNHGIATRLEFSSHAALL